VQSGGCKTDDLIPGTNVPAIDDVFLFDNANAESRKIVVAGLIHPRHFGSFASDQGSSRQFTSCRNAGDYRFRLRGGKGGSGEIIQEVQGFRAHHENIVDTHGNEINTDRVVAVQCDRKLEFGADTVSARDQYRFFVPFCGQLKKSAEAADAAEAFGPLGPSDQRFDAFDEIVTRVDINAGVAVTEGGIAWRGHRKTQELNQTLMVSYVRSGKGVESSRLSVFSGYRARIESRMSLLHQLPNLLTLLRIGAVPVLILFLYEGRYGAALVVFVIAGITDGLDGWIAKRFDAVTRLGSILDPLADKMLIVSTYVMLTLAGDIPFWLLLLIGFRDLGIIGGVLVLQWVHGEVRMQPSPVSKLNTFLQILLVVLIMLEQVEWLVLAPLTDAVLWLVVATTLASAFHYVYFWVLRSSDAEA